MSLASLNEAPRAPMPLPDRGHFRGDRPDIFGDEGHPLAVIHIQNHVDLGLHTHDFVELVLILGGSAQHLTEHGGYALSTGDAFVITPGLAHGYAEAQRLELCNILFDPVGLRLPRDELARLPGYHGLFELEPSFRATHRFQSRLFLAPAARQEVLTWVGSLEDELRMRTDGYRHMSLALLIRIIGFLSRAYTGMTTPTSRTLLAVNQVVSHIEHHYASDLSLDDLARMAHMCERTLQRYFQQAFGMPPVDYINRVRIGKACQLLHQPRLTITQVADAVGIPDASYFARVFRQFTGTTPSSYRQSPRHVQQAVHPLALAQNPRPLRSALP